MPFVAPAARFEVDDNNVHVLKSAVEFRETLIANIHAAKSRLIITSLYMGAEQSEIMDLIAKKAEAGLKVWSMTDYSRTLRPDTWKNGLTSTSAESMIRAMSDKANVDNWKAYLYLTPCSYRWQRWFPFRMQETLGVLHWKFYISDDDVIITGANIATSYLTNRHDRWMLIKSCPSLCDALVTLGELWHPCCHRLRFDNPPVVKGHSNSIITPSGVATKIPLDLPKCHLNDCLWKIEKYLPTVSEFTDDCEPVEYDSLAHKVRISLGIHCGYAPEGCTLSHTEPEFIVKTLRGPNHAKNSDVKTELTMATPYCNLSPETVALLSTELGENRELCIVGSSPNASSFFNGGPVLSAIPFAYVLLTLSALEALQSRIKLKYRAFLSQASSTFHAKGIWHVSKRTGQAIDGSTRRVLTIAGSTNFGLRSQTRDLECLFLIDTCSKGLVDQLEHEAAMIRNLSREDTDQLSDLRSGMSTISFITQIIAKFFSSNSFFRSLL